MVNIEREALIAKREISNSDEKTPDGLRLVALCEISPCANEQKPRAIIHLDMDCFYAAIEVRDRPSLRGKPVGVGGARERRGVLTTCNYEARKFGVRSAMPTFMALQRCPNLIVLPTRFDVYRREAAMIRGILYQFTSIIEPLSLDEAYLDVIRASDRAGSTGAGNPQCNFSDNEAHIFRGNWSKQIASRKSPAKLTSRTANSK